jgi:hypothetical protein
MPNADTPTIFLAAMASITKASPAKDTFAAVEINAIGRNLGLTDTDTLHLIRQLDADRRIQVEWGGEVKLLPLRDPKSVRLGKGAVYIGEGAHIGSGTAIGQNAMAAGAIRNAASALSAQDQATVDLAAAITLLTQSIAAGHTVESPELKKLLQQSQVILPELRSDRADKDKMKERLEEADQALNLLTKTGAVVTAAMPHLHSALELLRSGWSAISTLLAG